MVKGLYFVQKTVETIHFFILKTFLIVMLSIHCTSTSNVNTCCIFIVATILVGYALLKYFHTVWLC